MATTYQSPGVYVEEVPSGSRPIEGVGTAVAAFVGVTAKQPEPNIPTRLTSWSQYLDRFGEPTPVGYTALSVYNYFNNGGGACYVASIGTTGSNGANGSTESGHPELPLSTASLNSSTKSEQPVYTAISKPGAPLGLSVEVRHEESAPAGDGTDDDSGASEQFTLVVKHSGIEAETFTGLTPRKGKQNAATIVGEQSQLIELIETSTAGAVAERVPAAIETSLEMPPAETQLNSVNPGDLVGDVPARTGIGGLEAIDDITMVLAPDIMTAYQSGAIDLEGVKVVQRSIIDHCEKMGDRMAILDTPNDLDAQQVETWMRSDTGFSSKFATTYWPWIKVHNAGTGNPELVPPSGAMAGIWSRTDETRGVHKAPANEVVRGAIDLGINVSRYEHDALNPIGLNVIRSFPGRGIRVWGARTLASTTEPEWRYLNVRRLFNFLETSILNGTQWAVFEPNDLELWQRLKRTITAFLRTQWLNGALMGATPEEAFYVKCDADTNPPEVVEAGQVIVEIGVCPVRPAEFVVFRLQQLPVGGAIEEG